MHDTDRGPRSLSAKIETSPQPPLLAGRTLGAHREADQELGDGITIPNITCDSCQLQVIESHGRASRRAAGWVFVSPLRGPQHHARPEQADGRRALEVIGLQRTHPGARSASGRSDRD